MKHYHSFSLCLCIVLFPWHHHTSVVVAAASTSSQTQCTCHLQDNQQVLKHEKDAALEFKLIAIGSILVAGALGVGLPLLGKKIEALKPENNIFSMVKAFAGGVILATGFIHILPDAFSDLTSPCLKDSPWGQFPFTGFIAMVASIGTLMIDSVATGYFQRAQAKANKVVVTNVTGDRHHHQKVVVVVENEDHDDGHGHGIKMSTNLSDDHLNSSELVRHRIISQVLELGIVVHSVVIGLSMGVSQKPETIKSLLVAMSFHQFFEGMGLGGCISQAKFKNKSMAIMAAFFSLTAPVGIGIGMAVSNVYQENSPLALIIQGTLNSASAGILIYMALVDMLAADFMNHEMQSSVRLQLGSYASLLLGSGCMSFLAKWC